jgi:ribonuclease D
LLKLNAPIFPYAQKTKSPNRGLSELVRLCFGKTLNKSEQLSNWDNRPLRRAQIKYAGQ